MKGLQGRILRALSRVTSGGQLIPEIDGLRFIAISSVAMYHLLGYVLAKSPAQLTEGRYDSLLGVTLDRGWFGVMLFFVISGFVISLPFARHHLAGAQSVPLRQYYLRRVTRLEPPFVICVTLCFVLLIMVKHESFSELLPHYLSTITYNHNIVYGGRSTVAPVAWSLEIEIQFYTLAPLLMGVFALRWRRAILTAAITAMCLIQPLLHTLPPTLLLYGQFFLTGLLLADVYVGEWKESPQSSWSMDGVALLSTAGLYLMTTGRIWYNEPDGTPWWMDTLQCVLMCVWLFVGCVAAFRSRLFREFLTNPWIVVIGGMCYTIYLYHELVYSFIGRLAIRIHFTHYLWVNYWIAWILMALPMLVATSAIFIALEKPFMRRHWPSKLADWVHAKALMRQSTSR